MFPYESNLRKNLFYLYVLGNIDCILCKILLIIFTFKNSKCLDIKMHDRVKLLCAIV